MEFQQCIFAVLPVARALSQTTKGLQRREQCQAWNQSLAKSITMIVAAMGWKLDSITEDIEPVVTDKEVKSNFITVETGQVAGVKQIGLGKRKGEELIRLEFEVYLGAPESYDAVYISGTPNMEVIIRGGTFGDVATAAIVVNAIPRVLAAPPGLMTMLDIPLVHAYKAFET